MQFYETDMAGIVHFSWYFRYLEEAEHAMWREAGLSIAGWLRDRLAAGRSVLRISPAAEIRRRIRGASEIVGKDARTIRYEGVISRGETRIATGTLVVKCVSKRPGEPMRGDRYPAARFDALFQVAPGRLR